MRSNVILWGGTSVLLVTIALTKHWAWMGTLIGYWTGFLNSAWLYRDTQRSVGLDVAAAIRRMRRSFFVRLGIITFVVVGIARYQKSWLPGLAVGIAVGVLVSLFSMVWHYSKSGKG